MISVRAVGLISGGLVAAVAASGSYTHMQKLASDHGETWLSYLLPLSVDGLLVVASLVIVRARTSGNRVPGLAWFALVLGILVSLVANVAAAGPDLVSKLVAAWPPLAFALAYELVVSLARSTVEPVAEAVPELAELDPVEPEPVTSEESTEPTEVPSLEGRVRAVLAEAEAAGAKAPGRGAIAAQLGVKDHQVRRALQVIRQAQAPSLALVQGSQA